MEVMQSADGVRMGGMSESQFKGGLQLMYYCIFCTVIMTV
jgi:hypothetical protein